jgi:1,4-alpha-glucan branching enzyme
MKKIILLFLCMSTAAFSQVSISASTIEVDQSITITVNINSNATNCNSISNPSTVYMHSGVGTDANPWMNTIGNWGSDDGVGEMTNNNDGTWSITLVPETYYSISASQTSSISTMGMVFRNQTGAQELKASSCSDFFFNVGAFQLTLNAPSNITTILTSEQALQIVATATLTSSFTLKANGISIDQKAGIKTYSFSPTPSENTAYTLEANNNGDIKSIAFNAIIKPTVPEAAVPEGMKDGMNLDSSDYTKATLVFYAPEKEFIHLIGDVNNWAVDDNYLLKKDPSTDRFWIELTNLTPQTNHSYQYLIEGVLRVADPYSTTILSENNDSYINATTYPNLPSYPTGKTTHAVTVLRTGDTPYNWKTTNFTKPAKTDLVIYELLIRDFDALHSFDAVKSRLDYLQTLGINAIEFMPVSEFEGNESWGYNPSFHMALDKYYGTPNAFKQLIDECHRRGIAVILDVVYNHAAGQNSFYRMYNTDQGGYGGQAVANGPFFNQTATHSYSVFNDFNHSKQATKDYVKRTSQYWIDEYKVDGFRWDLTKGFTQNCTSNDEGCTGTYQADRVAVLKEYADYQWERDADSYVIFEHLGGNTEETEWVNYRLDEGKGILLWGNQNYDYRQAVAGNNNNSDFSWISYKNRGWSVPANVAYIESHDEERLMVEGLTNGKSTSSYTIRDLSITLDRLKMAGAFYFSVPGPKMIWQFGEIGYDFSINYNGRIGNKPIRWDYFENQERKDLYNTWAKMIQLKMNYDVFKTSNFTLTVGNTNGLKKIQLSNPTAPALKYVTIIGNFGITTQNINPTFQQTGLWYDLLHKNQSITVTNTNATLSLAPGEYKMYGNSPAALTTDDVVTNRQQMAVFPNPVKSTFQFKMSTDFVAIYTIEGKELMRFEGDFKANHKFSTNDISSGLYLLKTKGKQGIFIQKMIIY